jgi:hypothetical protein
MLQWWSEEDLKILRALYPTAPKKEIIKALNFQYRKKTWTAIQKKASRLKIERLVANPGRPKKKPKNYLGKKQLLEFLGKDLTIDEIAIKLRSEPHIVRRYITKYGL